MKMGSPVPLAAGKDIYRFRLKAGTYAAEEQPKWRRDGRRVPSFLGASSFKLDKQKRKPRSVKDDFIADVKQKIGTAAGAL